jgi:hypothetical protein
MDSAHPLRFLLILTLVTLACGLPTASTPPAPAPVDPTIPPPTETPPGLTLNQINNVRYPVSVREDGFVVQMVDGQYQQGTDPIDPDFAYVTVTQFVAFGDLTGDGIGDAAVIFLENYGGTGQFGVLAVYANVSGEPVFLHSTLIDDRPMVNSINIENSEIFVDAIVHGAEDGGCCPTLPTTRRYALVRNQLRLTHFTTDTPGGARRAIEITSPAGGAEVSGSVQVAGTISISPFENNLNWFIFDEAGNQFGAGWLMVDAPDLGAPGTFDEVFTLEGIPAGTTVYLEIHDTNQADGSLFALDVVKLVVR